MLRLVGDQVPTVDVLIPCCGEDVDIILDTVRAACALDYPKDRYRIVVLDDGNSVHVENAIAILRKTHVNLFYTARGVDVTAHSKGANLNHGLCFVDKLGPSEYVAVLDIDMIPLPHFLRALLPELLDQPSLAMTTSPQLFYNIPDGDLFFQTLSLLFNIAWFIRDASDEIMCTGTGFIVRRSAVEAIGGIPTDQISDAMMTSLPLWEKGWKISYIWEPLQWGLVPDSYAGHAKQAKRWAKSYMAIVSAVLPGPRTPSFSMGKRVGIILPILVLSSSMVALAFTMLFVPAILISTRPFIASISQQLGKLLTLSALQLLATWTYGFVTAEAVDFQIPIWPPYSRTFLAPLQSMSILGVFFPIKLGGRYITSGSPLHASRERESRASNSSVRRVKIAMGDRGSWFYLLVITSTIFGVTHYSRTTLSLRDAGPQYQLQTLLVGVAWPPAFVHGWLFVAECWIPLSFFIFPPQIPSREALLSRDPDTKIAYPSEMAKDQVRIRPSQGLGIMVVIYVVSMLACSWAINFQ